MTKFCKDCKFHMHIGSGHYCELPDIGLGTYSPVTGEENTALRWSSCSKARASDEPLECGPFARHFQPSLTYRVVTFFKRGIP